MKTREELVSELKEAKLKTESGKMTIGEFSVIVDRLHNEDIERQASEHRASLEDELKKATKVVNGQRVPAYSPKAIDIALDQVMARTTFNPSL